MLPRSVLLVSLASFLFGGCERLPEVAFDLNAPVPELFSQMSFFSIENGWPVYSEGVVPYALNSPLFSDFALKDRAIYVPEGVSGTANGEDVLAFPVGTVLMKSFSFPKDFRTPGVGRTMVETRLLVHYNSGWKPFPFIWNDEQTEAVLQVEGEVRGIDFIDGAGNERHSTYLIPQKNQCFECHEMKDEDGKRYITPIGTKPRYLNRLIEWKGASVNQLQVLEEEGVVSSKIEVGPDATGTEMADFFMLETPTNEQIQKAARDYLDINCAHCHRPNGISGITSQLFLNVENDDLFHLGVCKRPGSAGEGTGGLSFDIVPSEPEHSILYYRVYTENVGAMMPMIGRSLAHDDGAELIRKWIQIMSPDSCSE